MNVIVRGKMKEKQRKERKETVAKEKEVEKEEEWAKVLIKVLGNKGREECVGK